MGLTLTIGTALLGGYLNGRAQQQQANAAAAQAEANAQIAYNNAEKTQKQAEQQAQNNAINEENKRRQLSREYGAQAANAGAAGITMSGSALESMATSKYNMESELGVDRYNARQTVDNMFQSSTDYLNQGDIYSASAKDYRKAGKRAMLNSMLQSTASLAIGMYGANAMAKAMQGTTTATETAGAVNDAATSNYGFYKDYFDKTAFGQITPYGLGDYGTANMYNPFAASTDRWGLSGTFGKYVGSNSWRNWKNWNK